MRTIRSCVVRVVSLLEDEKAYLLRHNIVRLDSS
jgi:hypothetical protein